MAKKSKNKKSEPKNQTPKIIVLVIAIIGILITVTKCMGYEPEQYIKEYIDDMISQSDGENGNAPDDADDGFKPESSTLNPKTEDMMRLHFIDIGQGDCIFIRSGGKNMLIDCGEDSESDKVISYIKGLGIKKLHYVVATHPHSDHMGGMGDVLNAFNIGEVIMPDLPDKDIPTTRYFEKFLNVCEDKDIKITTAKLGRTIKMGNAKAEIIAPNNKEYSNANNYSVGMLITHGENSFLFTGDAETLAEKEMLAAGQLHDIDVYKAGHHGSDTSSSKEFLKTISPDYVVIMCGEGNSYGHPCQSTLKNLKKYTKQIYRTDLCGTVVCESDGENLAFRTER